MHHDRALRPGRDRRPRRLTVLGPSPSPAILGASCGCSSMVEHQLPKLRTRVRFPSSAHRHPLTIPVTRVAGSPASDRRRRLTRGDRPQTARRDHSRQEDPVSTGRAAGLGDASSPGFVLTGRGSQSTADSLAVVQTHWTSIDKIVVADPHGPWTFAITTERYDPWLSTDRRSPAPSATDHAHANMRALGGAGHGQAPTDSDRYALTIASPRPHSLPDITRPGVCRVRDYRAGFDRRSR